MQTAVGADIEASGALDLSDFLNRRFNGVFVNEMQNNPFQPDLNYRGYTASPLLGTPQGLSIYMDGVRLNQPFGDVVSWDLIPRMAIGSTTLMPGSNPLFGLNTLGGALSIQTKDGRTSPGTTVRAIYGSDVRRAVEFEHGGSRASGLHWYVAGNLFAEDGWRDDSPSNVGQLFGKLGWHAHERDTALSVGYADNSLTGNGLQEQRFLDRDFASVYTKPDETDNRATFLNLTTRHDWSRTLSFSGNVYYRDIRTQHVQRRHQRRFARSGRVSAERRRSRRRWRPRATPGFRPAARTRRTRRFRSGAASPTCCSTTSRARSATGC